MDYKLKDIDIFKINKLLAKFMRRKWDIEYYNGFKGLYILDSSCEKIQQEIDYSRGYEIMYVVEKIESLKHPVYISSNSCTIYENIGKDHGWMIDKYGKTKKEAILVACVEFVKLYNMTHKNVK